MSLDGRSRSRDLPERHSAGWAFPALRPRDGGLPARFAAALGAPHPAVTFAAAAALCLVAMAAISIALGLVVRHVALGPLGLSGPDSEAVRTLVDQRTGTLTDISAVGSQAGGGFVLPAIVALVATGAAIARRWALAAFAVFVLMIESATYRITTLVLPRDRPDVPRLENLPVDASYPSGHTAASVAVYSGLVLLVTSRLTGSLARTLLWSFAILMTTFVALSRMYRGMHHPLDVAGGIVVGVCAVLAMLFACRAAGAAAQARRERAGSA